MLGVEVQTLPVAHAADSGGLVLPALGALWLLGTITVAARSLARWMRIRQALHESAHASLSFVIPVRSSAAQLEPAVVGFLRPVLLLPKGIEERLTPEQVSAVLAHERCHVAWRDNLAAALHMLVEALFWFHPLIWWLGARLVDERERACDERVLADGHPPESYAEGILRVCEHYLQSSLSCVAGVGGAHLRQRIEAIMNNRLIETLSGIQKLVIGVAASATIAVPLAVGVLTSPHAYAQAGASSTEKPNLLTQLWAPTFKDTDISPIAVPLAVGVPTSPHAYAQAGASSTEKPNFSTRLWTPNFKDADITTIAEAVSAATGKNFIIDPRVRAKVTILSSTPISPAAFYQLFLSVLEAHDFTAEPAGDVIKIVPDPNRQLPAIDRPDQMSSTSDELVTEVVNVKNVSAAQLVPILRPMVPPYGSLAAYPAANMLIISDRASNVNRLIQIIGRIDQVGDQDVEIIPLQNASAGEAVRVLNSLLAGDAAAAQGGTPVNIVPDEVSNSVRISGGDASQRLRLRALAMQLDTPLESGGETQIRYLRYVDAEKIAPTVKEAMTGIGRASTDASGQVAAAQSADENSAMVWADRSTNALIIRAPPRIMRAVMSIIDKLDIASQ